jgi:hypothetical protein
MLEPPEFNESWAAVILDDCHLYTAVQQQAAFNWFVNALSAPDGRRAGCWPPAMCRPPTWRCARICAPASAGAMCSPCRP